MTYRDTIERALKELGFTRHEVDSFIRRGFEKEWHQKIPLGKNAEIIAEMKFEIGNALKERNHENLRHSGTY